MAKKATKKPAEETKPRFAIVPAKPLQRGKAEPVPRFAIEDKGYRMGWLLNDQEEADAKLAAVRKQFGED